MLRSSTSIGRVMRPAARDVERPWGRMRVWERGTGPPLLAVHGLGGSGRYFGAIGAALEERFRLIAPDLAGFGASDKPEGETYDRAFHLANLDAAIAGVDGPITVLGHSIGGVFAAFWAGANVERVRAVALVATPYPDGDAAHLWMREGRPPSRHALATHVIRLLVPALSLPIGVARGYPASVAIDHGRQKLLSRARTMWWALHDPGVRDELDGVGRSLPDIPVYLMHARDDRTVSFTAMSRWADLLPHVETHAIPTGGHHFLIRTGADVFIGWLARTLRA